MSLAQFHGAAFQIRVEERNQMRSLISGNHREPHQLADPEVFPLTELNRHVIIRLPRRTAFLCIAGGAILFLATFLRRRVRGTVTKLFDG